jgi:radical SAM superfamily enzyme YgiQ (UPF0313 family)
MPNSILQIGASIDGLFGYVFVDGNHEKNPLEKISGYLDTGEFAYFASTVMPGPQTMDAIPITKYIRQNYSNVYTIWGGYFPTMYYKVVMESGFVDFVIQGIGDYAFPQLLRLLEKNSPKFHTGIDEGILNELIEIDNLIFLLHGNIVRNPVRHRIAYHELNPLPYEHLNQFYPLDRYILKTFLGTRTTSYHASMGCPYNCSFCATVPMFNSCLSVQDLDEVYKNIRYLKTKFGVNAIEFNDNEFFFSEDRVSKLARMLIGEDISWWAYGRIDLINRYKDQTLALLKESGCKMIFFGAETGNSKMLRKINKGGSATNVTELQLLKRFKQFGIIPEYSFVLGFPDKTPRLVAEQIENDLEFIMGIKRIHPETEIIVNFYRPVAVDKSDLYNTVLSYGYRFPETLEDWLDPYRRIHTFAPVKYFKWFPEKSARKIEGFVTVLHAYHPSISDFHLSRFQKKIMKLLAYWRYHLKIFANPIEINLLQKYWLKYKRPEEDGFYSNQDRLANDNHAVDDNN